MMQVLKADKREGKGRQQWSPYEDNGGSCAAVAGPGFAVVGADTRQSSGYAVCARDFCKVQQIVLPTTTTTTTAAGGSVSSSSSAVLAAAGMQADVAELRRTLRADAVAYAHAHGGRHMSTPALAQHLGNTLYRRRFFPYYAFCVLAGVVSDGDGGDGGSRGVCYSYDAVGSFEEVSAAACGSAQTLVQAFLDSQLSAFSSHNALSQQKQKQLTVAEAKDLVREALTSAAERDIHTGDFLDIVVVSAAEGVSKERLPLKFD